MVLWVVGGGRRGARGRSCIIITEPDIEPPLATLTFSYPGLHEYLLQNCCQARQYEGIYMCDDDCVAPSEWGAGHAMWFATRNGRHSDRIDAVATAVPPLPSTQMLIALRGEGRSTCFLCNSPCHTCVHLYWRLDFWSLRYQPQPGPLFCIASTCVLPFPHQSHSLRGHQNIAWKIDP